MDNNCRRGLQYVYLSAPQHVQKLLEDFPDVLSSNRFTASKPTLVLWFMLNLGD